MPTAYSCPSMRCLLDHCRSVAQVKDHYDKQWMAGRRQAAAPLKEQAQSMVQQQPLTIAAVAQIENESSGQAARNLEKGPIGLADLIASTRRFAPRNEAFRLPYASVQGLLEAQPG